MSNLALISIFMGILIIVGRGPLLFAPERTLKFIRKLINKKLFLRILGVPITLLGITMITSASSSDQSAALIFHVLGWLIAFAAVLALLFTSSAQKIAIFVWGMSNTKARVLGFFSIIIGGMFIYIGLEVF